MGGGREEGAENFGQNEILYYIYQRRRPRGFAAMWNNGAKRADSLSGRVRSVHLSVSSSARLSVHSLSCGQLDEAY